ncbi:hypothetical protein Emin_0981 [Elusimicrobium minutum Pei191]|uniref:Rad50/SbcC-type AAA domain-containing protein n=1 Tax=Elusimicrobium minutum (strain Pei191) TaxID=445932 RepID=B2KDD8_ELUMP|nr:ATP-binding protein [Elusimicrobium minutum]ACC98534.1 hypothetical protein Emin_0981 [Elusimicrobium minutum Pei191]
MSKEIISLQLENIKKIKAITIRPEGNFVEISGRNGQGKSTVLDAIWWVLKGKDNIQQMPVRQGQEKGTIRLELNDLIIERVFKVNEVGTDYTTTIKVTSKDGAKYSSPQAVLDKFTGILGFDPLAFMRMSAKEQYEFIRKNADLKVDIDELDRKHKSLYEQRTEVNREVKRLEAQIESMPIVNVPKERVDVATLMSVLQNAQESNQKIQKAKYALDSLTQKKISKQDEIKRLEAQILSIKSDVEQLDVDIRRGLEFMRSNQPIDTTDIESKIKDAETINAAFDAAVNRDKLVTQKINEEAHVIHLNNEMESLENQKKQAIESANLPVKELGFGNNELLYKGLPIKQLSAAEQLKLSMDIATAENPDLKVILLRDASLLDDESLEYIKQRAEESGYQIWAERVDTTGTKGFVIEDGELKA